MAWFTNERRLWLAACLACALVGFGIGNGHTTQGAIAQVSDQLGQNKAALVKVQKQTIPALKAQVVEAHCERDLAVAMTGQPVNIHCPDAAPTAK